MYLPLDLHWLMLTSWQICRQQHGGDSQGKLQVQSAIFCGMNARALGVGDTCAGLSAAATVGISCSNSKTVQQQLQLQQLLATVRHRASADLHLLDYEWCRCQVACIVASVRLIHSRRFFFFFCFFFLVVEFEALQRWLLLVCFAVAPHVMPEQIQRRVICHKTHEVHCRYCSMQASKMTQE